MDLSDSEFVRIVPKQVKFPTCKLQSVASTCDDLSEAWRECERDSKPIAISPGAGLRSGGFLRLAIAIRPWQAKIEIRPNSAAAGFGDCPHRRVIIVSLLPDPEKRNDPLRPDDTDTGNPHTAVLMSGGMDSAVLAADLARNGTQVHPVYVRFGLRWEDVELAHAERFVAALGHSLVAPVTVLDQPMGDAYGDHWSRSGPVPDERSPDEAVYLPGRNVLLVAKVAVWCALRGIRTIHSGVLAGNPFPDATEAFFATLTRAISMGLEWPIEVIRPYSTLKKTDVIRIGRDFPLEHTFSCLAPVAGGHCGRCNKCAERRNVFRDAGIEDTTHYAG